jgi:hypothetical protein
MIAKRRGSQNLAGAASLRNRMPAVVGTFGCHTDIAHRVERQRFKLLAAGSNPAIQFTADKQ